MPQTQQSTLQASGRANVGFAAPVPHVSTVDDRRAAVTVTGRTGDMAVKGRDHCHPPATLATFRQGWVPRPVGVRNRRSGGVCVGMYVCICHLVTYKHTHTGALLYIPSSAEIYKPSLPYMYMLRGVTR